MQLTDRLVTQRAGECAVPGVYADARESQTRGSSTVYWLP